MREIPKNKLWALVPTEENLKELENWGRCYANNDHCLVIAPDGPKGSREVKEKLLGLLEEEDWAWIMGQAEEIRREQEELYHREIMEMRESFLREFEKRLMARKEELDNGKGKQSPCKHDRERGGAD